MYWLGPIFVSIMPGGDVLGHGPEYKRPTPMQRHYLEHFNLSVPDTREEAAEKIRRDVARHS